MSEKDFSLVRKWVILGVSLAWFGTQLCWAGFGFPGVILVRPVHLAFAMALVYLAHPLRFSNPKLRPLEWVLNLFPLGLIGLAAVHYIFDYDRFLTRFAMMDELTFLDLLVGVGMMVLLFECGRRVIGAFLSIFALLFILYGVLGPILPGFLAHHGL